MADITSLPSIPWSSKAVFADAQNEVEHDTPSIALWLDPAGEVHWRQNTINRMQVLWILEAAKTKVLYE